MSPASERADRSPNQPDRSLGTPGLPYPAPKDRLELSAYKFHVVAKYLDDVKNHTSQLVRAIVFLWAMIIIPLILLYFAVAKYIDGMVSPFDWKWLAGIGCLGSIAIGAIGRRMSKRRRRLRGDPGPGRPGSAPDAAETGLDGFVQIAAESADED
jgi:hypothetical protein